MEKGKLDILYDAVGDLFKERLSRGIEDPYITSSDVLEYLEKYDIEDISLPYIQTTLGKPFVLKGYVLVGDARGIGFGKRKKRTYHVGPVLSWNLEILKDKFPEGEEYRCSTITHNKLKTTPVFKDGKIIRLDKEAGEEKEVITTIESAPSNLSDIQIGWGIISVVDSLRVDLKSMKEKYHDQISEVKKNDAKWRQVVKEKDSTIKELKDQIQVLKNKIERETRTFKLSDTFRGVDINKTRNFVG